MRLGVPNKIGRLCFLDGKSEYESEKLCLCFWRCAGGALRSRVAVASGREGKDGGALNRGVQRSGRVGGGFQGRFGSIMGVSGES
jgi:hypothetical protein